MGATKKVWNPFSKAYWSKDNLLGSEEERADFKNTFEQTKQELSSTNKTQDVGKKISSLGWKLTFLITIPILLTVFLGFLGMVLGGIVFILGLIMIFKK